MSKQFGISDYQAQIAEATALLNSPLEAIRKMAQGIIDKANKSIAKIQENTATLGDGVKVNAGDLVFSFDKATPCFDKQGNLVKLRIVSRVVDMVKKDSRDDTGYVYFGTIKEGQRAATVDDVAMDTSSHVKRYLAKGWYSTREAAVSAAVEHAAAKVTAAEKALEQAETLYHSAAYDEPTDIEIGTAATLALETVA